MPLINYRGATASLALATALFGVAGAGPALAGAAPVAAIAPDGAAPATLVPTSFANLPTRALPGNRHSHTFAVTYRNDASIGRVVAPQILVESTDAGPFLAPADVRIERRTADGSWQVVPIGNQTGTLYTDLVPAQQVLQPGAAFTQRYRITVMTPGAVGTVQPRVALYG